MNLHTTIYLHTPHEFPLLLQCLQYLQFLQALHFELPVQVAVNISASFLNCAVETKVLLKLNKQRIDKR